MELSLKNLWSLLRLTVLSPSPAARYVLDLPMTGAGRAAAFGTTAALSAMLLWGTYSAFPITMPDGTALEPVGPLTWAFMVGAGMALLSGIIFVVGRLAGGKARFGDLILLMAWFQFVQLCMYVAQVLLIVLLPPFGILATMVSLGLTVWILGHFIKVAHGFSAVLGPILGIVGGTILIFLMLLGGA